MGVIQAARTALCWKQCRARRFVLFCIAFVTCLGFLGEFGTRQPLQFHKEMLHLSASKPVTPSVFRTTTTTPTPKPTEEASGTTTVQLLDTIINTTQATLQNPTRPPSTARPTLSPDIYLPDVQFKLVTPHIEPVLPGNHSYFVLVLVNTAALGDNYFLRRQAIRKTWGNNTVEIKDTTVRANWKVVFTMGKSGDRSADERIEKEATEYNDVLVGDFEDVYMHLIIKTFMSHIWAHTRCKYVLKTDDDVFVRVPKLIDWLTSRSAGGPSRFYGGHIYTGYVVGRCVDHKWCISKKYYEKKVWPPFCAGAFHVLSSDIIPSLVKYTEVRRPFHMDDAYLGVATSELNITAVSIPGFNAYLGNSEMCSSNSVNAYEKYLAIGHKITPACMEMIHDNST